MTKIDFKWKQGHTRTVPWRVLTTNERTTVQFLYEINYYIDSVGGNPFEDLFFKTSQLFGNKIGKFCPSFK